MRMLRVFARMVGSVPSGWMRRVLLLLFVITGLFLIAMFAHAPPLGSLQTFTPRRVPGFNKSIFSLTEIHQHLVSFVVSNESSNLSTAQLKSFVPRDPRSIQSPWSWACVSGRCERRAVKSSRISLATCQAHCGDNSRLIWPRPTGDVVLGPESVTFHLQQVEFVLNANNPDVKDLLEQTKDVFLGNIRSLVKVPNTNGRTNVDSFTIYLHVGKDGQDYKMTLETDEAYKLEVELKRKSLEARIYGRTFYGVRHGLETLSQLIWWDEAARRQGSLRALSQVMVEDKPVFAYRGLMVDTGRQFFSLDQLKKVIDGMAASKLNTFHWHLSDTQSFPFDSAQYPEMARWGAYSGDQVYTPDDVRELVNYARVRGVRVLVEIDAPAHAGSGWQWGPEHGLGELALCVDQQPWPTYCGEPNCGQLNPINENTYRILEGLYKELLDITEVRDLVHIGGDEVNLECWAQYSNITAHMQAQNMTDYHALWAEFENKLIDRIVKVNGDQVPKAVILWSSPLTKRSYVNMYLNPKVHVVQSWGGSTWPETIELLEDGFRVILSHVDAWYLDCGFGRWRETGEAACGEYRTWQTVYNHRPWREYPSQSLGLLLGGEAAIWSEQVGQGSLEPRLWPRASALAERLWTDLPTNGYSVSENVYTRLSSHVEILSSRGIKAEAMWPNWCNYNPGKCL